VGKRQAKRVNEGRTSRKGRYRPNVVPRRPTDNVFGPYVRRVRACRVSGRKRCVLRHVESGRHQHRSEKIQSAAHKQIASARPAPSEQRRYGQSGAEHGGAKKCSEKPWIDDRDIYRLHGSNALGWWERSESLYHERRKREKDAGHQSAAEYCYQNRGKKEGINHRERRSINQLDDQVTAPYCAAF
jgi:hypothetical protein